MRILLMLAAAVAWPSSHAASACTVCHSKNPKMVKMHEELGLKDCFKCHARGLAPRGEAQKRQMATDSRCIRCHGNMTNDH